MERWSKLEEKELDVQETRRWLGPKSYNDNWDLVNYTSELRNSKGDFFAFVDFHENTGEIRECTHCLEYEIHNKLKPRILKKGEVKPPDYDDFVMCWECGNVFPIYESYPESEIKDSLETVNNPFDNESIFLSGESRKTQRRKRELRDSHKTGVKRYTSKRLQEPDDEDPEIQAEIDRHGSENVHIIK
jgi:hypothetical protein